MNRRFRLTRSQDFEQAKRDGKTFSNKLFKVNLRPTGTSDLRFGIIAGKSIGNAVTRNRCKRLMRASIQSMHASIQTGWDVVIVIRQPAARVDFSATLGGLRELLQRAGLIDGIPENAKR